MPRDGGRGEETKVCAPKSASLSPAYKAISSMGRASVTGGWLWSSKASPRRSPDSQSKTTPRASAVPACQEAQGPLCSDSQTSAELSPGPGTRATPVSEGEESDKGQTLGVQPNPCPSTPRPRLGSVQRLGQQSTCYKGADSQSVLSKLRTGGCPLAGRDEPHPHCGPLMGAPQGSTLVLPRAEPVCAVTAS